MVPVKRCRSGPQAHFQDGEALEPACEVYYDAPGALTGGTDPLMSLFLPDDGDGLWRAAPPNPEMPSISSWDGIYFVATPEFGWCNIDRWLNDRGPKAQLTVEVPDGFDGDNSAIYLAFADLPTALVGIEADPSTGAFEMLPELVPVGESVHVIFATESAGQWGYAVSSLDLAEHNSVVFDGGTVLIEVDLAGMVAAINAL
ncbi:MAG: hypothetical protein ACI8PZ_002450 [Myxococcota bacterium]|jgi:hypothetical protein